MSNCTHNLVKTSEVRPICQKKPIVNTPYEPCNAKDDLEKDIRKWESLMVSEKEDGQLDDKAVEEKSLMPETKKSRLESKPNETDFQKAVSNSLMAELEVITSGDNDKPTESPTPDAVYDESSVQWLTSSETKKEPTHTDSKAKPSDKQTGEKSFFEKVGERVTGFEIEKHPEAFDAMKKVIAQLKKHKKEIVSSIDHAKVLGWAEEGYVEYILAYFRTVRFLCNDRKRQLLKNEETLSVEHQKLLTMISDDLAEMTLIEQYLQNFPSVKF